MVSNIAEISRKVGLATSTVADILRDRSGYNKFIDLEIAQVSGPVFTTVHQPLG